MPDAKWELKETFRGLDYGWPSLAGGNAFLAHDAMMAPSSGSRATQGCLITDVGPFCYPQLIECVSPSHLTVQVDARCDMLIDQGQTRKTCEGTDV
jgi:hypothetical protein